MQLYQNAGRIRLAERAALVPDRAITHSKTRPARRDWACLLSLCSWQYYGECSSLCLSVSSAKSVVNTFFLVSRLALLAWRLQRKSELVPDKLTFTEAFTDDHVAAGDIPDPKLAWQG